MIDYIIDFSAKRKSIILLAILAAAICGALSMQRLSLDALPDLGEKQVVIYSRWDRSPEVVEDQVTYPIVTALLGAPKVRNVRGISEFGYSYVYVIFDESADLYWARSRTMEYLSTILPQLPEGVKPEIGPDSNGLGWVFQYVLQDDSGTHSLSELRALQDWRLRYVFKSVEGVSDVASLGGYTRQYQVKIDPVRLQSFDLPISRVADAVRNSNGDGGGGRLIEMGGAEYIIRGKAYVKSIQDIENIVLKAGEEGAAVRVSDVAEVSLGPDMRRGLAELDGTGETVSGIIIMRDGENALQLIDRVKSKINEIQSTLPSGVRIVPIYDRSELIKRSIDNLTSTILEIMITVSLVILLSLWHFPSAIVPLITIPAAIFIVFIPLQFFGVNVNIMSLGGIAIATGALVDATIVMIEQTHKRLERFEPASLTKTKGAVILSAMKEVGRPSFFALLVAAVSFLPVLALDAEEGRLFRPLAYTKILVMIVAALLAITLTPALRLFLADREPSFSLLQSRDHFFNGLFTGKVRREEDNSFNRILLRLYEPVVVWALQRKATVIISAMALILATIPLYMRIGSEFMPPLDEGVLLYMPTTAPGISISEASKLLQATDRIIKQFPEVDRVLGKAGRAETSTDPAPLSMFETLIVLRPHAQWPRIPTWYSSWAPEFLQKGLRWITPDHLSTEQLLKKLDATVSVPGLVNSWTMPVRGRIDMLTTGLRTPLGVKITGEDPEVIGRIGQEIEALLPQVNGTASVFAERASGGLFIDIDWKRDALYQYGVKLEEASREFRTAVGGEDVGTVFQGRERFPINVRYLRDFRSDLSQIERLLIPAADGHRMVPLSELASIHPVRGPAMLRDENGSLTGYVYVNLSGSDAGGYVKEATSLFKKQLVLPAGYRIAWSGQYVAMERVQQRLFFVVPLTLFLIFVLLVANTRSIPKAGIIMLAVPFSAAGAIWFLWWLGYNMSAATWIGVIALLGIDASGGIFMLLYLDLAYDDAKKNGKMRNTSDLYDAVLLGSAKRIRPKFMTVACMFLGLLPILWSTGAGSDVMKRIAAPMVGGVFSSFALELIIYPCLYQMWRQRTEAYEDDGRKIGAI